MNSCIMCKKETSRPKYCSLHCANSAPRRKIIKPQIQCQECGSDFSSKTFSQKYCSRSCAAKKNNRIYPKRVPKTSNCLLCGIQVATSVGIYCSREHAQEHKAQTRVLTWLETGVAGSEIRETSAIRKYLYEEQLNVCALCPQTREWNGQPLNFILDHIDGNSADSSRNNLRLVCPNCDFQLPTSKGRNRGNGRYSRRLRYANGESR
jgi:hypothetical protein